jgi:hypothetical protein
LRDDPVAQAALQWRGIVSYVLDQSAGLADRYYQYRYEDLCADVRGVLAGAFAAAGLRVDEASLARLPERLPLQNRKWRSGLSPAQIDIVTQIQGPLLERLGYEL